MMAPWSNVHNAVLSSNVIMEEMLKKMEGKWKLDRSENFEGFMKEMGMNVLVRKMAGSSKPEQDIKLDGDYLCVTTITGFWNSEQKIKLNSDYEHVQDKVHMKCSCKWEDGKLVVNQAPTDPAAKIKPQTIYREVTDDDEMLTTIHIGDVVCKRWFKRLT
ncbi:sodium/calcium exchanger regulatory protein 1-like [Liolophura sinensis]|uniref:sodium/calcium exchanger regulatory protein 1-like n=1 Tax=Liolophura sinensis TaxID=3198878 RepID=UPI0031581526